MPRTGISLRDRTDLQLAGCSTGRRCRLFARDIGLPEVMQLFLSCYLVESCPALPFSSLALSVGCVPRRT